MVQVFLQRNLLRRSPFSSQNPGKYTFKVNNYRTGDGEQGIPFTVIVNLAGDIQTFQDGWDCRVRGSNPGDDLSRMINVCTIEITQEMIDLLKVDTRLSAKQANRLDQFLPEFEAKFGDVTTEIADMSALDNHVLLIPQGVGAEAKLKELKALVRNQSEESIQSQRQSRETLGSRSRSGLNTFDDILQSILDKPGSVSLAISGRNYYPSTITS